MKIKYLVKDVHNININLKYRITYTKKMQQQKIAVQYYNTI